MIAKSFISLFISLFSMCLIGCGRQTSTKQSSYTALNDVPISAWKQLASKKIYFGHQSVGFNIIEGMQDLIKEHGQINLHITRTTSTEFALRTPVFAHSEIGRNGNPHSKVEEFVRIIEARGDAEVDLAFFKFCYADFDHATDVNGVFEYYRTTMSRLKRLHPSTTFVYVTVPLVSMNEGFKDWAKRILGRSIKDPYANVKRNQFNDLLRTELGGKELIFDLAGIESTFLDGRRASFTNAGKTYDALVPDYTNDGGHLNEAGRRIVAEQFLVFLATSL
jgi:hypothetical protein